MEKWRRMTYCNPTEDLILTELRDGNGRSPASFSDGWTVRRSDLRNTRSSHPNILPNPESWVLFWRNTTLCVTKRKCPIIFQTSTLAHGRLAWRECKGQSADFFFEMFFLPLRYKHGNIIGIKFYLRSSFRTNIIDYF